MLALSGLLGQSREAGVGQLGPRVASARRRGQVRGEGGSAQGAVSLSFQLASLYQAWHGGTRLSLASSELREGEAGISEQQQKW